MESLIIQVGGRQGRVRELVQSQAESVSIGRGFDNQIVLADPYVAPGQGCFLCDEGCWFFENHDDTNRVLLNNEILQSERVSLKSGDRLVLGRTEIQIFSPDHEIPPTRKLLMSGWLHDDSIGVLAALLALAGCNLLDFSVDYLLEATREFEWKSYVINLLWLNLILLVWSGIWAITGKLARQQYHFGQQLFISTVWLALLILASPVLTYLDFASNGATLSTIIMVLVLFVMVAGLAKFNLYFATSGRYAGVIGMVISVVIVGGLSMVNFLSQEDFDPHAQVSSELYPGFILFGEGESVESYFGEIDTMLKTADQE